MANIHTPDQMASRDMSKSTMSTRTDMIHYCEKFSVGDLMGQRGLGGEEHGSPHAGIQLGDKDQAKLDNIEAPLTDSGYASAPPRESEQAPPSKGDDSDDCDSRTIISAATTVLPDVAQHSISEVCNNMYNSIYRQVDEHNLEPFFEALPDLIKTFAIRFAHLNPNSTNRRIMHFVYSRYW
ncbi:hypothetical protein B0T14DRAFT_567289 [Immersiella caudata]|uniref:Uncharacterized protein n=1 Tax=Immersiella caudata TaxID=314043 RepID=A0AA39WS16_9PEZI|nr:hypothetical protein B0T14DRAFT_567289 [Immersiella caudata]